MRPPEFWAAGGALPALLAPLGAGYDLAGRLRRAIVRPETTAVPVVCVGNIVAGGTGKTPVVLSLARLLAARGVNAHCLTRGYRGRAAGPLRVAAGRHDAAAVGDEALLLAAAAPTWVARDRVAGARAAVAAGAEVIVMDDGFQNPALAKDLSLLVVDGAYGFGNGRVIPAGPLREPVHNGLARADAVILMGADARGLGKTLSGRLPVLRARLAPGPEGARLKGHRILAFAGIGRPDKFFATLGDLGAEVVETHALPDHHAYTRTEAEAFVARAAARDARAVTTEKDAVRLPPDLRARVDTLPVHVVWDEPAAIEALLERALAHTASRHAAAG